MSDIHTRADLRGTRFFVFRLFAIALGCMLVSGTTQADITKLNEDETAKQLYNASGLKELIAQIPLSTARSFETSLSAQQLPELFKSVDEESIRGAVKKAFNTEVFDKYLLKELHNGMSRVSRDEMLNWYTTDLGGRVKQAEIDNSLLTAQTRFEDYQLFIRRYPVNDVREKLVLGLDTTMKSTDSAVDMMTNIQVAFNLSLSRFMPAEQRLSRQQIVDMAKQNQEALLSQYKQQTHEVLLFTYQALSNDDLVLLNEMLGTDAGQQFVAAINSGIKKGLFSASLDLGDGLGMLLDNAEQNPGI